MTVKVRGVRDINTLYAQSHRARTRTRAQVVAELAYLEHEKDRLDRELATWVTNQQQAASRLGYVRDRIANLQGILEAEHSTKRQAAVDTEEVKDDIQSTETRWRETSLEY